LRNQRILLLVCLLFLASFLLVAQLKNSFVMIDLQTNSWATSIQTPSFTPIAVAIAYIFDTTSLAAVSLVLAVYLFYINYRKYSVLLLAAIGGDALIVSIAKNLVHSPRPLNGLVYDAGFSFPSGHTTASIVFCGLLTYLIWQHWKSPKAKTVSSAVSIATISLVAFDRIYLNVHWFSDVFGACLLGLFWLTFALWVFRHVEKAEKFQRFKFWAKPTSVSVQLLLIKTRVKNRFKPLQTFFSNQEQRRSISP
jgi:undecaprenyl-diphosphatase